MVFLLVACSERFEGNDDTGVDSAPGIVDTDPGIDTDPDTGRSDEPIGLCINELMPDNESAVADETAAYPDWIELHNPTDEAIPLAGWYLTDNRLDPQKHTIGDVTLEPGAFVVFWADELPALGPEHLDFALDNEGGEVAVYAPDGRGSIVTYGPMAADFSIARVPDCCEGDGCLAYDFRGSPGDSNVDPVYEDVPLVATGATWKYWDQGTNPGAGWETPGFDDAAWLSGPGVLGYGDAHIVTTVSYGADAANKYTTTWFRLQFDAPGTELATLTLSLLRDDGAVVYLNGTEVVRDNLPEGDLTDTTLASGAVPTAEETAYTDWTLDPASLRAGVNTLAVAIHQASLDSSDLGFDLALNAQIEVPPE